MRRRTAGDILGVIEKIRYASDMANASVLYSKIMMDNEAALMNPGNVVAFLYLEQYYYRAAGNASLSILVTQEEGVQMVTIISPTTKDSWLFERADITFSQKVKNVLSENGFVVVMEWNEFTGTWDSANPSAE
ncbi:MAG: hypothetical protein IK125_02080 [Lachnospiraceae bacterium]|nr:hypothetical protein [Lachnospiraceae bacterium]